MENGFRFKFEIFATDIDWSQILKNTCQQLLSLNNSLKQLYFCFLIWDWSDSEVYSELSNCSSSQHFSCFAN